MHLALTVYALSELAYVDVVGWFGFRAIKRLVTRTKARKRPVTPDTIPDVIAAVEIACIFYARKARCLQRSAVVTRLLRKHGVPATLVIGCRLPPLMAHAWVEVASDVVSDDLPGLPHFRVLDRW